MSSERILKLNESLNEAGSKTGFECMECGKKFKKPLGKSTSDVKCPKCGGYDVDLAEGRVPLREAKAPTSSMYGMVGKYVWPDFLKTVKAKSGKLTWKDNRAISLALWMAQFDGYTSSDVTFDGTLTMYFDRDEMYIKLNWNDASKGGNEREWKVKHFQDYSLIAAEIGKHLKQWQGV